VDHLIPLHRAFSCVWCFRAPAQTSLTQTAVLQVPVRHLATVGASDSAVNCAPYKCFASSSSSSSSSLLTAVNRNTQGAEVNSRIAVSNGKGFQSRLTAGCLWGVMNFAPDFAVRNCWQRSLNSGCTTHRYRSLITLYVYVFCFETVVHIVKPFVPSGSGITVLILLAHRPYKIPKKPVGGALNIRGCKTAVFFSFKYHFGFSFSFTLTFSFSLSF